MPQASRFAVIVGLALAAAIPSATAQAPDPVAAALAKLDPLVRETMARTGVPGIAVAVVHADRVVHIEGYGVRAVDATDSVDADTVFQLASVSKPIAATVVASLVGDGIVAWDDPVATHDPGFRLVDPWVASAVTLRDLFSHRSGLPAYAGDLLEDIGYERADVLFRLRYQRLTGSFRARYAYTNFGLTEAAVAAAKAAGRSWEDLSEERLYRPLGMTRTSSRHADFVARANRARGHVRAGDRWVVGPERQPDAQSPAGGVSSSVRDLAQWMRLQLGGGSVDGTPIVAAAALAETHRPQIVSSVPKDPTVDRAGFYGLGWNVGYDSRGGVRLGHSGGFGMGAATVVDLAPAARLGIVVLTNAAPSGVPEAIARTFMELVRDGQPERDWVDVLGQAFAVMFGPTYGTAVDYSRPPSAPVPPVAGAYAGTYGNDLYGPIIVAEAGGGLVLKLGPRQAAYPLRHFDRDVFTWQPPGENAYGLGAVSFAIGADRRATSVTIENLDLDRQGRFVRVPDPAR